MMKLKLSNIDMRNENIIEPLNDSVSRNSNMIFLDVSKSNLSPNILEKLSLCLSEKSANMRNINLSYNILEFDFGNSNYDHSQTFIENIMNFFKLAKYLNHINFSGMNFQK